MATLAQVRAELLNILPWLGWQSTATGGGNNYIGDTVKLKGSSEAADRYRRMWIHRPTAAATADRVRRALTLSAEQLSLAGSVTWTNNPSNGDLYGIWAIDPDQAFNLLVSMMENLSIPWLVPFTGALGRADGDMQLSGQSNWRTNGTLTTKEKTTTEAEVLPGMRQGLKLVLGDVNSFAVCDDIPINGVQPVRVFWAGRCSGAGTGEVQLYNRTAGADTLLTSYTFTNEDWVRGYFSYDVPSTVEKVAVGLGGQTNGMTLFYSYLAVFRGQDRVLPLQAWATNASKVRNFKTAFYHYNLADGIWDFRSREFTNELPRNWSVQQQPFSQQPMIIKMPSGVPDEVWLEGVRKGADITTFANTAAGETSPDCPLEKRWLAVNWGREICRYVLGADKNHLRARESLAALDLEIGAKQPENPIESMSERPEMFTHYGAI